MTIRRANPRIQGEIGLAQAIAWFQSNGYQVCIPLCDNQPWDLVVIDADGRPLKVQVKTTTRRNRAGNFVIQLEVRGGNQSFYTGKLFDNKSVDLVWALDDDENAYLIPAREIHARRTLTLSPKVRRFQVVVGPGFEPG